MKIQQIRNATLIVTYAGKKFLIDPFLAEKGAYPGFPGTKNSEKRNPLVDLPVSMKEILDVDAVIITHTHPDHFDEAAIQAIPKDMKIFVQNASEAEEVENAGFANVEVISQQGTMFADVKLIPTNGKHGVGSEVEQIYKESGFSSDVIGVVFNNPAEKVLYIAGDTVWCEDVRATIRNYNPEVIVLNTGCAQFLNGGRIIMGKEDLWEVHNAAPDATIIASHMEAVNHATLSRAELKTFVQEKGINAKILIPEDGEKYNI